MATGTYVRPGAVNTYVRNHEATGNLIVSFSRNPNKFPLAKYAQYREVKKTSGLYLRIKAEECARIINANLEDYVWPDGNDAPIRPEMEEFRYEDYRTKRYAYPWQLGWKARDEADWPVTNVNQAIIAQKAMTGRTLKVLTALQTTGNWDATHIATVSAIETNTGNWEDSTSARQDIKRSITYAVELINKDTFGVVELEDLQLVMNPKTARRVGTSQEIIDFVKQQPSAPQILDGTSQWLLEQYGLPARLYGVPIVIENTVRVSTRAGAASTTKSYPLADGEAFILARPGSIKSAAGEGPTFSTITVFLKEEMTQEQKDDPDNRRVNGRVVDDFDAVMTAPVSGFWFRSTITADSSSS